MLESVAHGINKCPIHNAWIKKWRKGETGEKFRFCPTCYAQDLKANPQDYNQPLPITKKITL